MLRGSAPGSLVPEPFNGLTCSARRAGTRQPRIAMTAGMTVTLPNVNGSLGSRVRTAAPDNPSASPMATCLRLVRCALALGNVRHNSDDHREPNQVGRPGGRRADSGIIGAWSLVSIPDGPTSSARGRCTPNGCGLGRVASSGFTPRSTRATSIMRFAVSSSLRPRDCARA